MPTTLEPHPARTGRMVTLKVIVEEMLPLYFSPPLSLQAARRMLQNAGIHGVKTNPDCRRGGKVYYLRSAVERWLRQFTS